MGISNISSWFSCFLLAVCCISSQMPTVVASSKMVIYWGQNSIATWTNDPAKQEPDLRTYCNDGTYDIIVVGFVYLFPTAQGSAFPGMNFANHCEQPFDNANPFVLDCTKNIAPDIEYCQSRGKKIYLSFGGGVGLYGFASDSEAATFATLVWNMFLGGGAAGVPRPFGTSIFDGIDLDIEGGSAVGYTTFINVLRGYFAASSRDYSISAAPQCFYPDRIQPALNTGWFDELFIQFYNNHCGTQNYGNSMFNFQVWANWALTSSVNKNIKLFIGAPASPKAAASGYVPLATLQQIHTEISAQYPSLYGGLMLWDACTSDDNDYFGNKIAAFVHGNTGSSGNVAPATTGAKPKPATTGAKPKPVTTGAKPKPVTTGAVKPLTTGAMKPITTGAKPATTGALPAPVKVTTGKSNKRITTGRIAAATTGRLTTGAAAPSPDPVAVTSTSSTSADATGSVDGFRCTLGHMRCSSSNTYQSCGYSADGLHDWSPSQACQDGLVCSAAEPYIYCLRP